MKNIDTSRVSFDPAKNFSRVLKQQGRVELDADWNEQAALMLHTLRLMMADLVGPFAGPSHTHGFRVLLPGLKTPHEIDEPTQQLLQRCGPGELVLTRGRYYVDGLLCENHAPLLYRWPAGDAPGHHHLVFLDVWEREVTALEDASLLEPALGGADTTARAQVTWAVRTLAVPSRSRSGQAQNGCQADMSPSWSEHLEALQPKHRGALAVRTRPDGWESGLDETDAEPGTYRGVENQLYRIEIHRGGPTGCPQPPTFKWSRDNGTVAFGVESITAPNDGQLIVTLAAAPLDSASPLAAGQWVEIENLPDLWQSLQGRLLQIAEIDEAQQQLTLLRPAGAPSEAGASRAAADDSGLGCAQARTVLRRWDQSGARGRGSERGERGERGEGLIDGAVPIEEGAWLPLENGIEVRFDKHPGHRYRAGDYWLVAARVVTADVLWPRHEGKPRALPPMGVQHHYAPLALVTVSANRSELVAPLTRGFSYQRVKELGRDVLARDGD
ncbi:conserved hypothetical protein [Rubrivivax sp. A210]|uniref:DUF6519 domain-containing protein n=1 Tax=Rubrivivax sp. A210 TaxID=2772301 RepID=UPI00191A6549|nr:DUF6519 domain-containing protein [Rubrivivax sp. A210]CAD5367091.1 conserved hypothetical protein [Rubrivivax sp. A210]